MFELGGTATVVETDLDAVGLVVGSLRSLRHQGELFHATATSVATNQLLRLDTALLEASKPLLL